MRTTRYNTIGDARSDGWMSQSEVRNLGLVVRDTSGHNHYGYAYTAWTPTNFERYLGDATHAPQPGVPCVQSQMIGIGREKFAVMFRREDIEEYREIFGLIREFLEGMADEDEG